MTALSSSSFPTLSLSEQNHYSLNTYLDNHKSNSRSFYNPNPLCSKFFQRLPAVEKDSNFRIVMSQRKHFSLKRPNLHSSIVDTKNVFRHSEIFSDDPSLKFQPNIIPPNSSKFVSPQDYFNLSPNGSNILHKQDFLDDCNSELAVHVPFTEYTYRKEPITDIQDITFRKPSINNLDETWYCSSESIQSDLQMQRLPQFDIAKNSSILCGNAPTRKSDSLRIRKLLPSINLIKRKLLPTQSFDDSILNTSNTGEDYVQSTTCSGSIDSGHVFKEIGLKNSHSADKNLHTYSNFTDFICEHKKQNRYMKIKQNDIITVDLKPNHRDTNSDKRYLSYCSSASSIERSDIFRYPNTSHHDVDNQHIFIPIIRSESTPCIYPPPLRIGIKRRLKETQRPAANFSKMYNSQINPCVSTPSVSPVEDLKRFSSRSPESIPEDWECESVLKDIPFYEKSNQFNNIRSGSEKLDLQSIEEN
ncbi:hypothetical protein LOD99_3956 [Oopsacas minuta]|uniref:Uncharacterized protein n=1 Tax=Oopsacas minuta TaxID=111878 RepID=A0AAV7JXD8_9METZ|nr:hypothetical protein LOD99_3956 [Oopsacas minuta]